MKRFALLAVLALVVASPVSALDPVNTQENLCCEAIAITSHATGATVTTTVALAGTYNRGTQNDPVGIEIWYRKTGTVKWFKAVIVGCGGTWSHNLTPGAGNYEIMALVSNSSASETITNVTVN